MTGIRQIDELNRRTKYLFVLLTIALGVIFCLDVFLGSVSIDPHDVLRVLKGESMGDIGMIILNFRLPKAFSAIIVGAALSVSGLQMQTIFRNPMAGPDVLGISSGAGLGVALVILGSASIFSSDLASFSGNWIMAIAASIGAATVLILIMVISVRIKDIMIILILGIMLSSGITAIVTVLQFFSNETMLKAFVQWTMGSLGNLTSDQLFVLSISTLAGLIISFLSLKMMNALLLGENYAKTLGLNVKTSRILIFTSTSILAGSITAFCGPIGFIGIAVPHISRLMFRTSDHRIMLPGTLITGSCIMLVCDIISQLPGTGNVLPINAITSFIGIPIVIWVILKNRKFSTM